MKWKVTSITTERGDVVEEYIDDIRIYIDNKQYKEAISLSQKADTIIGKRDNNSQLTNKIQDLYKEATINLFQSNIFGFVKLNKLQKKIILRSFMCALLCCIVTVLDYYVIFSIPSYKPSEIYIILNTIPVSVILSVIIILYVIVWLSMYKKFVMICKVIQGIKLCLLTVCVVCWIMEAEFYPILYMCPYFVLGLICFNMLISDNNITDEEKDEALSAGGAICILGVLILALPNSDIYDKFNRDKLPSLSYSFLISFVVCFFVMNFIPKSEAIFLEYSMFTYTSTLLITNMDTGVDFHK